MNNLNLLLPEIFISISLMSLLMIGVFKNKSQKIVYNLTIFILVILLAFTVNLFLVDDISLFNESYKIDKLSTYMKSLIIVSAIFIMLTSYQYLNIIKIFKIEYPILILGSMLGMMVMTSSNDLIVFYLGLELQSLALYVLASFNREISYLQNQD